MSSTSEFTATGAEEAVLGFERWGLVRACALALYVVCLALWTAAYGIPVQRELVIAWTCGALACASIGRPPREILQLVLDWLPIVAVLWLYDLTRGAADTMGIAVNVEPMIDFDEAVFFGQVPTEWLQDHLYEAGAVMWWDVVFTLVYTSYFIVPFALAGYFWARDRPAFQRFTRRLVTLALAGLATYILFPAMPPWLAAETGALEEVHRTTGKGWEVIGFGTASLFSKGQAGSNLVAAVPSLHTAFVTLVAFFLWGRVRPWLRPLLLLYPLAMGVTLIATGEHYAFDVFLGWLYAGAVMAGWGWWERYRDARAGVPPARATAG
ncbi:MAG TPA: phosphatase PAP2 family protein [Solirubrobacterales bacterium]|nr:phosphatase PAP2 family protein [Solirubrobacterales bacterium]